MGKIFGYAVATLMGIAAVLILVMVILGLAWTLIQFWKVVLGVS